MPPFIPRKRRRSRSPPPDAPTSSSARRQKLSLFDTADKPSASATLQDNEAFLDQLDGSGSESALSDVSSGDFEDVLSPPSSKNSKIVPQSEDDHDGVVWESAMHLDGTPSTRPGPELSGDLELTLDNGTRTDYGDDALWRKKGPSKTERQRRVATHCLHVQFLLFHNLVRNGWACDKEVQTLLIGQLPTNVHREVDKWKTASGVASANGVPSPHPRQRHKGKKAAQSECNQRDWGKPAVRQEKGAPDMSRGDPLIRLLKILAAYWRKRFTITAPALRKQGYKPPARLADEIASFREDKHNPEEHGERVRNIQEFRELARRCEGSRDVGAQLFTALLRGLGLEARLVASLQPVGFGWSKREEASAKKKKTAKVGDIDDEGEAVGEKGPESDSKQAKTNPSKSAARAGGQMWRSNGAKDAPIDLSQDSGNDSREGNENGDDTSVIDVTPATPRRRPNLKYDRDMLFPTYWTEVISSITNEVYPVDSLVLNPAVATNAELLAAFESRGSKADKAKQVFAYIVGYSSDGTAKDVTTRYLKRHIWPGRTKGVRIPVERIPVYDHRGKIKRHEDYDWFKTVMSGYSRTESMRTVADEIEDINGLMIAESKQQEIRVSEDTLQGYKTSAEFVLVRHLRREEALRPGAKPVKTFFPGKGEKAKEEQVYLREDVEVCRTGESWHKEGRAIIAGETPMKMVPVRAVTLTRKREVEEAERDSGERPKQGLYAWDQTDWIIPPPIENGIVPKNAFGNMDCYVPTMVPKGAVHIPLRNTVRVCKKLGIDYAEAVTGFEFGNKRAVPVITGVVVAKENEQAVIDVWVKEEEERRIKEEGKKEKMALATWRKWLMGLRIIKRVRAEYGGDTDMDAHREEMNPVTNQSKGKKAPSVNDERGRVQCEDISGGYKAEDDMEGGGFFAKENHEEEVTDPRSKEELLIEGDEPLGKNRPIALASLVSHCKVNDSGHSSGDEVNGRPGEQGLEVESKANVKVSKKPTPKITSTRVNSSQATAPSTEALTNSKKRKAFPPLSDSDDDIDVYREPIARKTVRVAPKRTAARKSESAVKSHFFNHASDDEQNGDGPDSVSEENVVEKPAENRGKSKKGVSTSGRSLRGRRST